MIQYPLLEKIAGWLARALSRRMVRPERLWWDPGATLRTVAVDGAQEICYVKAGQGPPVLLLHGFGTSLSIWAGQIRALSERFQVFAVDLPGHGFSGKPATDYTPEMYIQALTGFMDTQGISSASLVGHSMGGLISLCLAAVDPGRVERLVLLSTSSPLYRPRGMMKLQGKILRKPWFWMRVLVLSELLIPLPVRFLERKGQSATVYDPGSVGAEWNDHFYDLRRMKGFSHMVISTVKHFPEIQKYEAAVRGIPQPVSLLWGEEDRVVPLEHGRMLTGMLGNATLETVPRCGHMITLEKPQWAARHILDSLQAPGGR
jgi:pimeloyl-ACP methyl ester carboxylesterase